MYLMTHRFRGGRIVPRAGRSGFSLIEAMIAATILAFMTTAIVGSIYFSSRATRLNTNAVMAKNIAQGVFERMYIDRFSNIGPTNYPSIPVNSNPPVWLDQQMGVRCAVTITFKGFGTLSSLGSGSLTDNSADWTPGEWVGSTVYLVAGQGMGQYATIQSNTAKTLNLVSGSSFNPSPLAGDTKYMINNGKTVRVETRWTYLGRTYRQAIESLIPNHRNEQNLGF